MASSSTLPIHKSCSYDVFLSFRGKDTRTNFVDHLYYALQQKGIHTYKDDERIKKGKKISDELVGSIEDSKLYIIVFSKNYASSSWCLDELVKIMECHKTNEHTAYPVFYDVEPSEVRKQSGAVENAFAKHENKEAAGKWREALKEAADLAGWELKNTADRHEAKFIKTVVEELSLELRTINFSIDEKLIGMETRIKDVLWYLGTGFNDVRMIGIKGMGGGGKTTLARVVFDQISFQFDGKSFVENVREASKASLFGLKSLQNQILSDVLNDQGIIVSSIYDGKNMMKRRMGGKKVLLVLDDVDHIEQLEALAGERNWFKPGSRIIITTRDEQVLVAHGVKSICNVKLLSDKEAICLFSRFAFGREIPNLGYEELSRQVVHYAAGLPLTIRVLGSFLCGKNELEWKDALDRLKRIPISETLEKLELSYFGLQEDYKEIFLNVACILKGWSKVLAIKALESCGFHARVGLRVLEQKSLITIHDNLDDGECLGMHDHIAEMGRNIVRRLHPDKPNKHSRLWINKEIDHILANDLGTKATRCMQFYTRKLSPEIVMKGLRKMKELRFLDLSVGFIGARKSDVFRRNWKFYELPNALRYLHWDHYPFRSLPKTFQAQNLVTLQMADSRIVQLWEGGERKVLNKLRFLDLSYSMLRTLDLGLTPNIETLNLKGCTDLVELHMSVGCFKLITIDLSRSMLRTLDLGLTPNIEMLNLKGCCNLVELHMPVGCFKLITVDLSRSMLRTLDLGSAPNLELIHLEGCSNLVELIMPCRCQNLRSLILNNSKLRTLDIGQTPNIEYLDLKNCYDLEELYMPHECQKLTFLNISRSKLRNLDIGLTPNLEKLDLKKCYNLVKLNMADECLTKVVYLDLSGCLRFKSFLFHIGGDASFSKMNAFFGEGDASCSEDDAFCGEGDASCSEDHDDESLKVGPLAELHLIAESLDGCPIHPESNLPKFKFSCFYKEDKPLLTRNLEKLIAVGLCACTNVETFSRSICGLQHLRKLKLQHNNLKTIQLKGLNFFTDLDLLEYLEKLDLIPLKFPKVNVCSFLEKLSEDLGPFESLNKLTVTFAMIKDLPDCICMLKHLESLKLNNCSVLEKLPENLGRLERLKKLTLTNAKIKDLPDSICMLKHLESLKLNYCLFLEKLPEDLGRLECLENLDLSYCKLLRDIPDSICKMKCLKYLSLYSCTQLEKLPGDFERLECLKELDLRGTCISHLPESIFFSRCIIGSRELPCVEILS